MQLLRTKNIMVLAFFFIAAAVIVGGILLYASLRPWCCLGIWLQDYQTLASGFLAVIAALATTALLFAQTFQQIEISNQNREGRRTAIRSLGPATLNELNAYGWKCWTYVLELYRHAPDQIVSHRSPRSKQSPQSKKVQPLEPIDRETLNNIKEWIEFEDTENRHHLIRLMENYQLFRARMPLSSEDMGYKTQLKLTLEQIADFLLTIDQSWNFARQESKSPGNEVSSKLDRVDDLFRPGMNIYSSDFDYDMATFGPLQDHLKEYFRKQET